MMNYALVINEIIILFLLLMVGYVVTKLKIIDESFIKKLSGLLLNVTLPALIISSMQLKEFTRELLTDTVLLISISIGSYILAIILAIFIPRMLRVASDKVGLYQFILVFANVGFIGYPLVESILGKEAVFYAAIYNLPFNLLVYTLGYYYMNKGKNQGEKFNIKQWLNPGVIAVFIGFILFISPVKLPLPINETISVVGGLTTPLSMIIVGGLLIGVRWKDMFTNYRLYLVSLYRMVIYPIIIFGLLTLIFKDSLDFFIMGVPVIVSSLPVAVNAAILAEKNQVYPEIASDAIFISTLLSMLTIPFITFILFK